MLDKWQKKEKPVFTGITRGIGGFGFGGGGAADSGDGGGFSASGGTVDALYDSSSQFAYHTFISPGTLTISGSATNAEILVIGPGGGGAGGNGGSGGGGAGGIVHVTSHTLQPGTYTIAVPAGGTGGAASNDSGNTGGDATVTHPGGLSLTAKGGGGGSGWTKAPNSGGSGGGAAGPGPDNGGATIQASTPQTLGPGGGSATPHGFAGGGVPSGPQFMGGGGGGTGAVGADGRDQPGNGGTGAQFSNYTGNKIGLPFINPLAGRYGGGGGGMAEVPSGKDGGTGGAGGGGRGARSRPQWYGSPGLVFTGSGGGGGQWWPQGSTSGGDGSQGMVVVRYPQPDSSAATGTAHTYGYRYWRLYKMDSAQSGAWTNEVQFFEVGSSTYYQGTNYQNWTKSNVAINSDWEQKLTNGNTSDNAIHTDTAGVGAWLKLDLGANNPRFFDRVKIWLDGTNVHSWWRIEASNNNSDWTVIHKGAQMDGLSSAEIFIGQ